jgi:hypothetical protein
MDRTAVVAAAILSWPIELCAVVAEYAKSGTFDFFV